MKTALQTVCFFLLFFFVFLICPSSCASEASVDRSLYTRQNFDAKICGTVRGMEIEGVLHNRPTAADSLAKAEFIFSEPEALKDLSLSLEADGGVSARLYGMTVTSDHIAPLANFFLPVIKMGEIKSVERSKDGEIKLCICDEDCNLEYVFLSSTLLPSRICGEYDGCMIDISIIEISNDAEEK